LFTPNYHDGVIQHLITDVSADDFNVAVGGQVEIIGWLYQYYNTEPKDTVIGMPKAHKFRDIEIASATQIFTPDWIVKYMVQNSLGKYWIRSLLMKGDSRTEAEIAEEFGWQYYMSDAEQPDSVQHELDTADNSLAKLDIVSFQVIDPSMGSGHILVYAFDLLMQIYESEGFSQREAAISILENNLNGLDIDTRAFQLSYFAVMMKARQYNRRILKRTVPLHVYDIPGTDDLHLSDFDVLTNQLTPNNAHVLQQLLMDFMHGNEIGSLISEDGSSLASLRKELTTLNQDQLSFELIPLIDKANAILNSAELLSKKYQIVITNPPYMGSSRMGQVLAKFTKKYYPNSKSDLFAMFIERWNKALVLGGYNAMVTMQSWMFLSSFEKMRVNLLDNYTISNLMHMENNVMGIAFGTAVSIIRNYQLPEFIGTYHQIKTADASGKIPVTVPIEGNRFNRTNQANFAKIPGMPIAYWASENLLHDFEVGTRMDELVDARQGLATADNNRFLRLWHEVVSNSISFHSSSIEDSVLSQKKWFPCNKGGSYRKWYGNYDFVVNWENNGDEVRHFTDEKGKVRSRPQNTNYYFREAITWSDITSGTFSLRYRSLGSIPDHKGMSAFSTNHNLLIMILALLNTPVGDYIFKMLNPTVSLEIGNFKSFPVLVDDRTESLSDKLTVDQVHSSKKDWDSFETSWDFTHHPLLSHIADDNLSHCRSPVG